MSPHQRGVRSTALCGLLLLVLSCAATAGTFADGPGGTDDQLRLPPVLHSATNSFASADAPVLLEEVNHTWMPGDVFSLHGVDQYRYIVVYSRDTADGRLHGCYEVELEPSGRYVVTTYIHGQEVFGDTFIAEQGGRFIEHVPLDQVVIMDDTPADGGRTYFGLTLGSIYGIPITPAPVESPSSAPTAVHWPSIQPTPTPTTTTVTAAPTQASPTMTPPVAPTLAPSGGLTSPPTVAPVTPGPTGSSNPVLVPATPATPGSSPVVTPVTLAPVIPTPEPTVTVSPWQAWGKRFAAWQAPSTSARRVDTAVSPTVTQPSSARELPTFRSFRRFYPPWTRSPGSSLATV